MRKVAIGLVLLPSVAGFSSFAPSAGRCAWQRCKAATRMTPVVTTAGVKTVRCSLYADQEKVIIARGELEETLMPPPTPLEAAKRGSAAGAGGGGFGAASTSKKGLSKQHAAEAKVLAKELRREGVIRIDNVLSHETADALLAYVKTLRIQAAEDVESSRVPPLQRFVCPFGRDICICICMYV